MCNDSYADSCFYTFAFLSFKDTDWGRVAKNLSQIPGIGMTFVKISCACAHIVLSKMCCRDCGDWPVSGNGRVCVPG